jgi:chromosomal replication initiator protein
LDAEMAKRAAGKIEDSRALEGFLLKLTSFLTASRSTEVTPQIIDKCLGKSKEAKTIAHPDDVISAVCEYFNIKTTQLKGARREASLVKPRHICMYLLKEDLGLPFVEIGNLLGGRDHTTVMHAVEKIKNMTSSSPHVNEDILSIKRRVIESFTQ